MTGSSPLAVTPSLANAVNRQILQVLPDTPVAEVIHRMSAVQAVCTLEEKGGGSQQAAENERIGPRATIADNPVVASTDLPGATDRSQAEFSKAKLGSDRTSCALVVDTLSENHPHQVIGIVTERDIVQLAASNLAGEQPLEKLPVSAVMTAPVKTMEVAAFQDIFAALFLFRRYRIRHLPIVNERNGLIGVVTPASIRQVLRPANLLKMRRVADVMSQAVVQAPPHVSVRHLAQMMADSRVSCVVIVDVADNDAVEDANLGEGDGYEPGPHLPIGIVTERDIVQFQALQLNLQEISAGAVMSSPLFLLDPQDSLWTAHQTMQEHRVRRLVVSWNWGQGLGIVTQTSLLRVFDPIEMYGIIDSLQNTVDQLASEKAPETESGDRRKERAELSSQTVLAQAIALIRQAKQSVRMNAACHERLTQASQLITQVQKNL